MVRFLFSELMETFHGRSGFIWLQLMLFMIICISRFSPVTSQNGFISIDCGSDQDRYDNTTGIFWETDANYILTGDNFKGITVKTDSADDFIVNRNQLGTLRYFSGPRTRDCYLLPTTPQHTYLVRATFYFGNWQNGSIANAFYVYLNGTEWTYFGYLYSEYYNPIEAYAEEAIVYSPGSVLNVCLVREQGSSFISTLELRELASGMYSEVVGPLNNVATILNLVSRLDCGPAISAPDFLRFPDDAYDRIWSKPGTFDNATHISNSTKLSSPLNLTATPDRPPVQVMETAWVYYHSNILWYSQGYNGPVPYPVYVTAYFQELDGNASATNVRGMKYYLNNDHYMTSFNTSDQALEIHGPKAVDLLTDDFINVTFVQESWSKLVPILNALEIYLAMPVNSSETALEDVTAISALQKQLNLSDWTGDPCMPVPFDFMSCTADVTDSTILRITNLSLTNMNISGPIPEGILNLTALTDLSLNNNDLTGSLPDSFSSLVHLQTLNLQHNKLSGSIPSFLGTLPNLTQLHLDNNNFTGTIPAALTNDTRLVNFTALNNPISNCTIRACGFIPAPASQPSPVGKSSSSGSNTGAVVGGILGALAALAIISGIVWYLCTRKRRARSSIIRALGQAENHGENSVSRKALAGSTSSLSLQEVSDATKRFQKKIGEGSFGPVYYGKLPNGEEVAVKVKSTDSRQGFHEFLNEVDLLSRIHHRNLVSLVGFCEEADQQMLIYVYVPNGTFRDHLYGDKTRKTLNWRTRLDIALNSARGLEYLHTDCNPRIIHRDVKTSNILLDDNMVAKVADFGISKQAPEGLFSGVDTLLKGTPGYFDPEYFITQRLTPKSDVYSFGVVLLEMISGRHPHVSDLPDGTTGTLIQWVQNSVRDGTPMDIVDPKLRGEFNEDSVMKVLFLALRSTNMVTAKRPDMAQVVRTLTEAIELEVLSEVTLKADHDTHTAIPEGKDEGLDFPAIDTRSLPGSSDISSPTPRGAVEPR